MYHLSITNCGLTSLGFGAFKRSAFWLDHLDLTSNSLTSIDFGIDHLYHLLQLNLAHNRIASLPPRAFFHNNELRRLNLSGNRLHDFPKEAFTGSAKLSTLDLSGNELSAKPDTSHMQWLGVSHCIQ